MTTPQPRILLVDDEPLLLTLMTTFLTKSGYRVESASSSASALALWAETGDFQVLVTDVSLKGMTGDQLGMHLAERDPRLRVLLCGGYPYDLNAIPAAGRPRFAVLQKPFIPKMLVESIEELLRREV